MLKWFKKRSQPSSQRQELLQRSHPVFKIVDAGFQIYIEVVSTNPSWDDNRIEEELRKRGVEDELAQELVSFVPLAFGREIVEQLGVKCSDKYIMRNLLDDSEHELPLAMELAYAWAKGMIGEYRNAERNNIFKLIAQRSAEFDAVNNALNQGANAEDLKGSTIGPCVVYLRRASKEGQRQPPNKTLH
jgi:hypothetical protein